MIYMTIYNQKSVYKKHSTHRPRFGTAAAGAAPHKTEAPGHRISNSAAFFQPCAVFVVCDDDDCVDTVVTLKKAVSTFAAF